MNNRQNGRRRGRNNPRPQGGNRGGFDSGNRIDSRARGNAAQLLEKYKNMARDAQMSGDRVLTEYYLQFADHYFRVLSDARSRQEEQRARFQDRDDDSREEPEAEAEEDEFDVIDSIGRAPRQRPQERGERAPEPLEPNPFLFLCDLEFGLLLPGSQRDPQLLVLLGVLFDGDALEHGVDGLAERLHARRGALWMCMNAAARADHDLSAERVDDVGHIGGRNAS